MNQLGNLLRTLATLGAPPEVRDRTNGNAAFFLLLTPMLLFLGIIVALVNGAWLLAGTIALILGALFAVRYATWKIRSRISHRATTDRP